MLKLIDDYRSVRHIPYPSSAVFCEYIALGTYWRDARRAYYNCDPEIEVSSASAWK